MSVNTEALSEDAAQDPFTKRVLANYRACLLFGGVERAEQLPKGEVIERYAAHNGLTVEELIGRLTSTVLELEEK